MSIPFARTARFYGPPLVVALLVAILVPTGCTQPFFPKEKKKNLASMPKHVKEEIEAGNTVLVGDLAVIGNNLPLQVLGVGLVKNLPRTGCNEKPSGERSRVLREMQKMGIDRPNEILASDTTAVVRLRGYMREGILEGERFDIEVFVPPDSETTSLRGGWLMGASLEVMMEDQYGALRSGKPIAYAEGPIFVNPTANPREQPAEMLRGKILGGAVATEGRSLALVMKRDSESVLISNRIANEINHRFFVPGNTKPIAEAKTEDLVDLRVHPVYRNNISRYIRIIQSIAMYENTAIQLERMERLKKELLIPAKAASASFQLEAIGKKGIPILKTGLAGKNAEVRFYSAVSLAYLNDSSAAEPLGQIVREHPEFRVFALDALGTMQNDFDAETVLRELLHESSAETRYGAFRALWYRNPLDPAIRGENLGGQFSYHGVVTRGPALIHITNSRRPEIVLFSPDIRLKTPFVNLDAGPMIVVTTNGPDSITVTKLVVQGVNEKRQTTARLDEIIRAVVELGGTFPDVVQMLYDAQAKDVLPCKFEVDKLPEAGRVFRRVHEEESEEETPVKPKRHFVDNLNPKTWFEKNRDKENPEYYNAADNDPRE